MNVTLKLFYDEFLIPNDTFDRRSPIDRMPTTFLPSSTGSDELACRSSAPCNVRRLFGPHTVKWLSMMSRTGVAATSCL